MRVAPLLRRQLIAYGVTFTVFSLKQLRHERAGTLKDQLPAMCGGILLRYRLSGNSYPGSAKNSGPELALAGMCCWPLFSHNRETFDAQVVQRQGGLDTNVKIFAYEDG